MTDDSSPSQQPPGLDTSVPHSARVWNYWLGGQDNYPPDRMVGDQVMAMFPDITRLARADRAFLGRAVRYLAGPAGLRQFLDIGTGLPTADNTHQVAQAIAADSRVVYVDNDPLVLAHARALLTSTPEGACDYVDADLRDPAAILAQAARTLDFSQPVALMMLGIVGNLPDASRPESIIRQLMSPLPSGSYLALSDGVNTSATFTEAVRRLQRELGQHLPSAQSGAAHRVLRRPGPGPARRGRAEPLAAGDQPAQPGRGARDGRRSAKAAEPGPVRPSRG